MTSKTSSLLPDVSQVTCQKATERPFTGKYNDLDEAGTYLCRQCGLPLFHAQSKFHSGCGWPSFDEEISPNVAHIPDADGMRTEIVCARCQAHLGHVFEGENFTAKNIRHCVNSLSLDFITGDTHPENTEEAILAAGCFWGVEYALKRLPGVLKTEVGYTGGQKDFPTYDDVCSGKTGHVEAVRVIYDPAKISYQTLLEHFFKIHDPTQIGGQGPDMGSQYLSVIFYYDEVQKKIAQQVMDGLNRKVSTHLLPVSTFWPAETYHQDYYDKLGKEPYCHKS